jgi:hypothetical protein
MVIDGNVIQFKNAEVPILVLVTELGMVIDANLEQDWNA